MKYVVDVDAFTDCLDCVDSIKVNGEYYIELKLLKEFVNRFPKDAVALYDDCEDVVIPYEVEPS